MAHVDLPLTKAGWPIGIRPPTETGRRAIPLFRGDPASVRRLIARNRGGRISMIPRYTS